jgi:hypothetical protein
MSSSVVYLFSGEDRFHAGLSQWHIMGTNLTSSMRIANIRAILSLLLSIYAEDVSNTYGRPEELHIYRTCLQSIASPGRSVVHH